MFLAPDAKTAKSSTTPETFDVGLLTPLPGAI